MLNRTPHIDRLFHAYLEDENSASLIKAVSTRYTNATLERLAVHGGQASRRGAILALSFLGNYSSNAVLGRALHDTDRGVRMLAENGIRDLWMRDGSAIVQQRLRVVAGLVDNCRYEEGIAAAGELIDDAPYFAEGWNQRAIAHFQLGRYAAAIRDAHQTLEINPYHFLAAAGMGNGYLELEDPLAALACFRRSIKLNPALEDVRSRVLQLERIFES